ncbi:Gfo/Idh/MocA family oxidoreductase [Microbacterium trichothecenolyticum]|uniref:Gfo/Idh/MocA family protein n=1 Tax=Microbacterium trichothecenolyticum TaxID=69370 RepID=UPI001C6EEE71|nr:Gfo/Idh/MocA family oxidoreductase [Microbacterium trichothecenolyticum]MBW9120455.1 Gfo/Idh/MocA family oxidoreductase [Microbacterium trichothecenolyticum]
MHRWAVIGTGDISDRLVPDLQAVAAGTITAAWGRTPERAATFAAAHDIPFATDSREELLQRTDVDVVYIATPAHTHADIAVEALEAGKHVLIEKPVATTAADAERIFDVARRARRFAMEAMWMRFNPLHVEVLDRISGGLLGEVSSVRASFGTPFQARGRTLTPAQGGSILRDRGIYPIMLAQWFLGQPLHVQASGEFMDGTDVEGHATLEAADGFAQLAWSGTRFLDLSATVSGARGWVTLDPMFWAGTRARVHAGSAERIFASPEIVEHPREGNGYRPMLSAVIGALDDGLLEHPWHGRDDTVALARTMDAVLADMHACAVAEEVSR